MTCSGISSTSARRDQRKAAGGILTAEQAPHRPGTAPALGLRAGGSPLHLIANRLRKGASTAQNRGGSDDRPARNARKKSRNPLGNPRAFFALRGGRGRGMPCLGTVMTRTAHPSKQGAEA